MKYFPRYLAELILSEVMTRSVSWLISSATSPFQLPFTMPPHAPSWTNQSRVLWVEYPPITAHFDPLEGEVEAEVSGELADEVDTEAGAAFELGGVWVPLLLCDVDPHWGTGTLQLATSGLLCILSVHIQKFLLKSPHQTSFIEAVEFKIVKIIWPAFQSCEAIQLN